MTERPFTESDERKLHLYRDALAALVARLGGQVSISFEELSAQESLLNRQTQGGFEFRSVLRSKQ